VHAVRALCLALLSLIAGTVLAAEVFKSVDENGNVTFSDRPGGSDIERVFVDTSTPTPAPSVTAAAAPAAEQDTPPPVAAGDETEPQPTEEGLVEQRRRNCEIATERAERYERSRRLYRALPDGEREYLNEEETAAARADAEADVATWCG
jgi:hypothetical protein